MKERGLWKALLCYLRERLGLVVWPGLCLGAFGLLCWLYGLPLSAVVYGLLLCLLAGLPMAGAGFVRYHRRYQALARLEKAPLNESSLLPEPGTRVEAAYTGLLKRALRENGEAASQARENARRQLETYSLWTHQIKVPISAMKLILSEGGDRRNAVLAAELLKIEQYTDMALHLARLNASATDYVIRECRLDDILRQLIRRFAPLFIQKRLYIHYEPADWTVVTDEKWLLFALEQVLSNAVKYTKEGGVTVAFHTDREELIISDTGIGVDPADLPRVFDQGYTGYNGRGDKRATGLGLYLCRLTLNRLGHTIRLTSVPGQGTTAAIGLGRDVVTHE